MTLIEKYKKMRKRCDPDTLHDTVIVMLTRGLQVGQMDRAYKIQHIAKWQHYYRRQATYERKALKFSQPDAVAPTPTSEELHDEFLRLQEEFENPHERALRLVAELDEKKAHGMTQKEITAWYDKHFPHILRSSAYSIICRARKALREGKE